MKEYLKLTQQVVNDGGPLMRVEAAELGSIPKEVVRRHQRKLAGSQKGTRRHDVAKTRDALIIDSDLARRNTAIRSGNVRGDCQSAG